MNILFGHLIVSPPVFLYTEKIYGMYTGHTSSIWEVSGLALTYYVEEECGLFWVISSINIIWICLEFYLLNHFVSTLWPLPISRNLYLHYDIMYKFTLHTRYLLNCQNYSTSSSTSDIDGSKTSTFHHSIQKGFSFIMGGTS